MEGIYQLSPTEFAPQVHDIYIFNNHLNLYNAGSTQRYA